MPNLLAVAVVVHFYFAFSISTPTDAEKNELTDPL